VSLVLFALALRHLGSARTGPYFSLAPFFGAVIAIILLREPVTAQLVVAGLLVAFGLWPRDDNLRIAPVSVGGYAAWAEAGLPLVPEGKLLPRDPHGRTVWATRSRPKIDRIACPWLIRLLVVAEAVFLFVSPAEVQSVAERFNGAPFDIEGIFWSHRSELCTFDTKLDELGLRTEPLASWRRS
jgi:Chromate resistance exported protein